MIIQEVKDVLLRKSFFTFHPDTNIFMLDGIDLNFLSLNRILSVQVVQQYEDEELIKLKRHACLFRLLCSIKAIEADTPPDTAKTFFEIEAELDVIFDADSQVEVEELEEFSSNDIINHAAWPYWKEHVSSLCSKAGLNPLQVPPPQKNEPLKITAKRRL